MPPPVTPTPAPLLPTSPPTAPPPPPPPPAPSTPEPPAPIWGPPPETSAKAIAIVSLGACSPFLLCFYGAGIIPAVIALVLWPLARREIRESNGRIVGDQLVTIGMIFSWVTVGLTAVAVAIFATIFLFALVAGSA